MNATTTARAVLRLGERLSRVPRRPAATAALLAVLATGGLGVLLASAQPAAQASTARDVVSRPSGARPVPFPPKHRDERWDKRPREHRLPAPTPAAPANS